MTAQAKTNPWLGWQRRLHAKAAGAAMPMSYTDSPDVGFYRSWFRDKTTRKLHSEPVAFVREGMEVVCYVGRGESRRRIADSDGGSTGDMWTRVCNDPIAEALYRDVAERGQPWPDESTAVTEAERQSNVAPEPGGFDDLKAQIEDLHNEAKRMLEQGAAATEDASNQASNVADKLHDLGKQVEAQRKQALIPAVELENAANARWAPLMTLASIYVSLKAKVVTPFLKRREAEQAEKAAQQIAHGERPEPAKAQSGTRGRAQTLRKFLVDVEILDRDAVLAHFKEGKAMTEFLTDQCKAAFRAKLEVPGAKPVVEERAV